MCEIPSTWASRLDGIANIYTRGRNTLQLPLKHKVQVWEGSSCCRAEGIQRQDCKKHSSGCQAGRKWKAQVVVDQAINRLQHKEVMKGVQEGRAGFSWGEPEFQVIMVMQIHKWWLVSQLAMPYPWCTTLTDLLIAIENEWDPSIWQHWIFLCMHHYSFRAREGQSFTSSNAECWMTL